MRLAHEHIRIRMPIHMYSVLLGLCFGGSFYEGQHKNVWMEI